MVTTSTLRAELEATSSTLISQTQPILETVFKPWAEKTPEHYIEYLRNQYLLADHVLVNVGLALQGSPRIDVQLRKVFLEYGLEELGHELWIAQDLAAIGAEVRPAGWVPHYAMSALIAHSETVIRANPIAYFGHAFQFEAFAASLKPYIKEGRAFGYPKNAMRFLGSHAQINDAHADLLINSITKFTRNDAEAEAVAFASSVTARLLTQFLLEIVRGA